MPKDQMKEGQLCLYAHPKLCLIIKQLMRSQPSRETKRKICVTTTRNLDIGHEIARRKQLTYDIKDKSKKWFLLWNKHFWPQQMFQ